MISRDRRWSMGVVALFLMAMSGALQADMPEWRPVTAQELAMTSEPRAPDAPAIILYMQVVRDDRESREDRYVQIKILTDDGRSNADIEIAYDDKREHLKDIEARTVRKDGTIVPFTGKIFEKPLATGSDRKVLTRVLALTDVEVGSIVEYRFSRISRGGTYNVRWLLSNSLFTREARYSFRGDQAFRYGTPRGLPPGSTPITEGKSGFMELRTRNVPAQVDEEFPPPGGESQYRLDFTYAWEDSRLATEPAKFWKKYADAQRKDTREYVFGGGGLKSVVKALAPVSDAPGVRLRKLYEACAGLRNKSWEPARTDEEIEREDDNSPWSVQDIWKQKAGWAYQINLLFLAMVQEAGFKAAEVLVADRSQIFFDPKRMDPGPLDLRLIAVELDGKDLYLSPGTKFLPFGDLAWQATAQPGLRIERDKYAWVEIPALTPAQSRSVYTARLALSPDGILKGRVIMTQTGQEAMWRRSRENNEDAAHRREFLQDDLIAKLGHSATARVIKEPDWSGAGDFVVEYELMIRDAVLQSGNRRMFSQSFFASAFNKAFQSSVRVQPVYIWYPYETEEDVEIELPPGWKVGNLPDGASSDVKKVMYSIQSLKREGQAEAVLTKRRFRMNLLLLQPEAYGALRQFHEMVRAGDEQQIVVMSGGN